MKTFAIKVLISALKMFDNAIVSRINSAWVKRVVTLMMKRLTLFGEALVDGDPNNKEQIEKIARETLVSPEFQDLQRQLTIELAAKIPNQKLATVLVSTENLRMQFFAVLGDDDSANAAQIKELFESYLKSEDFDVMAITFAELLAEKYAKNEMAREFIVSIVTSLVNSDDN
jgi:hypothetical protein